MTLKPLFKFAIVASLSVIASVIVWERIRPLTWRDASADVLRVFQAKGAPDGRFLFPEELKALGLSEKDAYQVIRNDALSYLGSAKVTLAGKPPMESGSRILLAMQIDSGTDSIEVPLEIIETGYGPKYRIGMIPLLVLRYLEAKYRKGDEEAKRSFGQLSSQLTRDGFRGFWRLGDGTVDVWPVTLKDR